MLFELVKTESGLTPSDKGLIAQPPSDLGLLESDIENWLAGKPSFFCPMKNCL
jgi:hypothetical protein